MHLILLFVIISYCERQASDLPISLRGHSASCSGAIDACGAPYGRSDQEFFNAGPRHVVVLD